MDLTIFSAFTVSVSVFICFSYWLLHAIAFPNGTLSFISHCTVAAAAALCLYLIVGQVL